eukprot:4076416-Prymnesium_polylepis.1
MACVCPRTVRLLGNHVCVLVWPMAYDAPGPGAVTDATRALWCLVLVPSAGTTWFAGHRWCLDSPRARESNSSTT